MSEQAQRPTPQQLLVAACLEWGISEADLLGPGRSADLVDARREIAVVLRARGWRLESIGHVLHRHRTTVMSLLARAQRDKSLTGPPRAV